MADHSAHGGSSPGGLQEELRDLLRLAVVGDHVRWVLRGEGASDMVPWLSGAVTQWRAWAEDVAQRMVEQDLAPDGRVKALARDITRQWVRPGWLSAPDAKALLRRRLSDLVEWTPDRRSRSSRNEDKTFLTEVESGLNAQLTALSKLTSELQG